VYKGFVFFGLIKVDGEPFVIEYNCRMGDPETEVVMPRLDSDIVQHFAAVADGTLANEQISISDQAACTVVVASGGYPDDYEKYKVIKGLDTAATADTMIFHSGTKNSGHDIVTNGGRVLAVTSLGSDIKDAVAKSNHAIEQIQFDKKYYRKDIGYEFK
jgi:phosphoribosylamine--glycine ligase